MALFATIGAGMMLGSNFWGYHFTLWDDEEMISNHPIPDLISDINNLASNIVISPDETCVALTVCDGPNDRVRTWVYFLVRDEEEGTIEVGDIIEVHQLGSGSGTTAGPFTRLVRWSPRGLFISPTGHYAYDPYKRELINLPGPTPGLPFSILPYTGLIFEGINPTPTTEPEEYLITARDLFTGEIVPVPDGVNDPRFIRPNAVALSANAWTDYGLTEGQLFCSYWTNYGSRTFQRFISNRGWALDRSSSIGSLYPFTTIEGGTLLIEHASIPPYGHYPIWLLKDDGTLNIYTTFPSLGFGVYPYRLLYASSQVGNNFTYNNCQFFTDSWRDIERPGTPVPILQGINLFGSTVVGTPPAWTYSREPWGASSMSLISARSAERVRYAVEQDGIFWTNRRYAKEVVV